MEASSLLDFGATPVNESKVGDVCLLKIQHLFFVSLHFKNFF